MPPAPPTVGSYAGYAPGSAAGQATRPPSPTGPWTGHVAPPAPVTPYARPERRRGSSILTSAIVLVAILAGAGLFLSGYSMGHRNATQPGGAAAGDVSFQPFWDAYSAIDTRFAGGDIDYKALVEGAIKGMFEALGDPYSSYLTSEEYRASLQGISGEFEGIGATIGTRRADGTEEACAPLGLDCRLVVVEPLEGSPALEAGLEAGDVIVAIDGTTVDGLTLDQAIGLVRGEKGTEVVLAVERDGAPATDVPITRDVIIEQEVISRDLADGEVGYIAVTGFSEHAADDFVTALQEDVDAGRTKIIVDLRGNPGGFTTAARTIASQFIGSGPLFWEQDANGNQVPRDADADGIATDAGIEVVLLVDGGSASASEIVAGALHDTGRATIVGQTTYGKGTVQQWTPLDNDYGGYRLTIARWLTPDRTWIHGVGVEPDVAVDDAPEGSEDDPFVDAALEVLGETEAAVIRPAA
jgi:carboxyl-terminal processing protease